MYIDDPDGQNYYHYIIGWNLGTNGAPASWSGDFMGPKLGYYDAGGGAALGDIDGNGRPDLLLMAMDNPGAKNSPWYLIGRNLGTDGKAASWSSTKVVDTVLIYPSQGGGAALADIDGNGKLDAVLEWVRGDPGDNDIYFLVGFDVDINGGASKWTHFSCPVQIGWSQSGGGAAIADIDGNGALDILALAIDKP